MEVKLEIVKVTKSDDLNIIIGQTHFIKSVEDLYEAIAGASSAIKFGVAFCEASGKCLVRLEGNDEALKSAARDNALRIACGHCFVVLLKDGYPINVLNQIKNTPEVCGIFCATANPVEVIVAVTGQGRGIMGIVDGFVPKGVESKEDIAWRKDLLRKIGYKL